MRLRSPHPLTRVPVFGGTLGRALVFGRKWTKSELRRVGGVRPRGVTEALNDFYAKFVVWSQQAPIDRRH